MSWTCGLDSLRAGTSDTVSMHTRILHVAKGGRHGDGTELDVGVVSPVRVANRNRVDLLRHGLILRALDLVLRLPSNAVHRHRDLELVLALALNYEGQRGEVAQRCPEAAPLAKLQQF